MLTQEHLKKKIKSAQDLQSVVKTMKAMAAVNIRQYEKAAASLDDFCLPVEMGLRAVLRGRIRRLSPRLEQKHTGLIVFGSDQGMCGQFNEQAAGFGKKLNADSVICIGERLIPHFENKLYTAFSLPGQVLAITDRVQELSLAVESWQKQKQIGQMLVCHNQPAVPSSTVHHFQLLPLDQNWLQQTASRAWPSRSIPLFPRPVENTFSSFISQYLFLALFRSFALSLAAENSARLSAMQAAEKNIGEMIDDLQRGYNQGRQNSITEEILDIIAGVQSLA